MPKHASALDMNYQTLFDPLPVPTDDPLYFDKEAGELPYAQDFLTLHYHDRYEIGICVGGSGLFLSEGIFSAVSEGDFVFIAPGMRHYSRSLHRDALCMCRFAYIRSEAVERVISLSVFGDKKRAGAVKAAEKRIPPVLHASEYPRLCASLSEIMAVCKSERPDSSSLAILRLSLFLIEAQRAFDDITSAMPLPHQSDDAVAKISEYLALSYNEADSVKELSARCHLSESQLRRRFLAVYGMPPIAYRSLLRCRIAAELLTRTRLPISEIALRIGYTADSDFYRAFKKCYGVSPSVYRTLSK